MSRRRRSRGEAAPFSWHVIRGTIQTRMPWLWPPPDPYGRSTSRRQLMEQRRRLVTRTLQIGTLLVILLLLIRLGRKDAPQRDGNIVKIEVTPIPEVRQVIRARSDPHEKHPGKYEGVHVIA